MTIRPPRYTMIPNELLEELPKLKESEVKVMLAVCRFTFGFHRKTWRAKLTTLMDYTGMSKQGVLNGVEGLKKRKWLEQTTEGVSEWTILFEVNEVDREGQRSRPPSKKETNRNKKNTTRGKPRDERLDHPAIQAYRSMARLHVPIVMRDDVIEVVGEDEYRVNAWGEAVKDWIGHGWKPQNVKGMLEYYQEKNKTSRRLPRGRDL